MQSPFTGILEPKKRKSVTTSTFPPMFAMNYEAVYHELNFFIFSCKPALHFLLVAQMVKNLAAIQETQVLSLGWEDPLEKGMTTHSRILAWRSPWTEEPGRLQSMGSQRDTTE